MRKMMKAIAAVLAVSALMAGSAFAADKLSVKGTDGSTNVFRVDDTGLTEAKGAWSTTDSAQYNNPVLGVYNSGVLRMKVKPLGITEWYLNNTAGEAGAIKYSTPGGGAGIGLFTGATYDQNQFNMAVYPTLGTGSTALAAFGYASGSTGMVTLDRSTGNVGIGLLYAANVPTVKLDVDGNAIRIRTAQSPASGAACSAGAIAWDTGYIYVCTATGAWKRAALTGGY